MMRSLIVCLLITFFVHVAEAADWPHWMGPTGDNVWHEKGLLKSFPADGPKIVWRAPVAGGYAGPAVVAGRVFLTDYISDEKVEGPNNEQKVYSGTERVLCLDEATGKLLWDHDYRVNYTISYPAGPRCTPTVHESKVYTLGAEGNLFCFDVETGDILWSKDFRKEYADKTAMWGYASHPLIDEQKLICIVGGEGSHAVAFDKDTGKEIWRAVTAEEQGYCPPLIIQAQGSRQLILMRPDAMTSVDPESGQEYWSVPYQADNASIIVRPVYWEGHLFAGGFNNKTLMLKLPPGPPAAEVLWANKKKHGLSPVNVQPFLDHGLMYGVDQNGELMAVEFPGGERLWETSAPLGKRRVSTGTAFIVQQADRYWLFNELGEIIIAKLSREGYEEIDRAKVIEPTNVAYGRDVVWTMPAFANKRMYVRNGKECICVELSAGQ